MYDCRVDVRTFQNGELVDSSYSQEILDDGELAKVRFRQFEADHRGWHVTVYLRGVAGSYHADAVKHLEDGQSVWHLLRIDRR